MHRFHICREMFAEKIGKVEQEFSKVVQLLSLETISSQTPSRKKISRRRIKYLRTHMLMDNSGRWKECKEGGRAPYNLYLLNASCLSSCVRSVRSSMFFKEMTQFRGKI